MKKCIRNLKKENRQNRIIGVSILVLLVFSYQGYGQDGLAGINEANQKVRSYFDAGTQLM